MTTWINKDGLTVRFGPTETEKARVTEYSTKGPKRVVEIVVDADFLPAAGAILLDSYRFYKGSKVTRVTASAESETYVDGTSITVALVEEDNSEPQDLATFTLAELNAQEDAVVDVNIDPTDAPKVVRLTTVGTFSAGKSTILIEFEVPKEETDTIAPMKPYSV